MCLADICDNRFNYLLFSPIYFLLIYTSPSKIIKPKNIPKASSVTPVFGITCLSGSSGFSYSGSCGSSGSSGLGSSGSSGSSGGTSSFSIVKPSYISPE